MKGNAKSTAKVDESQKNLHEKDEEKQKNDAKKDDKKQPEHHVVANLDQ